MRITIKQAICLALYYGFAQYLPSSYSIVPWIGRASNALRVILCHGIFKKCGKITTVNRKACFGSGRNIEMGDGSGLGAYCNIPSNTIIGKNVMMGAKVLILSRNHKFDRTDIPMCQQGYYDNKQTIIEDDCWIGHNVQFTPGRHVAKGTIVGMGSVLTKDFPPYSIVGGAPAKFIKSRKNDS